MNIYIYKENALYKFITITTDPNYVRLPVAERDMAVL